MGINTLFKNIADAIRSKGESSDTLTPAQMPQAILDLPSGGGSSLYNYIEPIKTDVSGGYVSPPYWYYDPNDLTRLDVYEVTEGHIYLLHLGATVGNRFRPALFQVDPTIQNMDVTGASVGGSADNPIPYKIGCSPNNTLAWLVVPQGYHYLVVGKSNQNTLGIKTYLVEFNESA